MTVNATLPQGPDDPPWQQVKRWIEDPVGLWEECARKYGDTFTVRLGSIGTVVLFTRPEDVREIFRLGTDTYECRHYNGHYREVMGDRSLLVSDGAEHKRRRLLLGPPLFRQKRSGDAAIVRDATRGVIDACAVDEIFPARIAAHYISLNVMLEVLFGKKYEAIAREIADWFAAEVRPGLGSSGPWSQFVHLQPRLRDLISGAIRWGRREPDPESPLLFDALVRSQDEAGLNLDDSELQDHIFTMLIAGVDPPALALAWALYWIHETPDVLARLRSELVALGPDPKPELVADLPYLSAVCHETLRMYPIVATPTGRKLTVPATVGGWHFEQGTTLLPCTYLVHRRADLFPDASRFQPERFLNGTTYAPHEYLPFGGGHRYCIGATLGLLEMKLALATILTELELAPAHTGPVRPVRYGTLLAPSADLRLIVTGRSPNTPSNV